MLAVVPGAIPVRPPTSVQGGGPLVEAEPLGAGDAASMPLRVSTVTPSFSFTIVASCGWGPSFLTFTVCFPAVSEFRSNEKSLRVSDASPAGSCLVAAVPVTSSGAIIPFATWGVPSGDEMKQTNAYDPG